MVITYIAKVCIACLNLHAWSCMSLAVFSWTVPQLFCVQLFSVQLLLPLGFDEAACVLLSAGHDVPDGTEVESDTAHIRHTTSVSQSHTACETCCHIVWVCHTSTQPQTNMFTTQSHLLLLIGQEHSWAR